MANTVRFSDGFDDPDVVALGLPAPQLLLVVAAAAVSYCVLHLNGPLPLEGALALMTMAVASVLAWGRALDQPLLAWATAAGLYALRPRERSFILLATDQDGHSGSPTDAVANPGQPVSGVDDAHESQPWARWLRRPSSTRGVAVPASTAADDDAVTPDNAIDWLRQALAPPEVEEVAGATLTGSGGSATDAVPPPPQLSVLADDVPESDEQQPEDEDGEDDADPVIIPFARALADEGGEIDIELTGEEQSTEPLAPPGAAAPVFVGATRRVTFFALNGGTGRTTLATEVAGLLAARGRHSRDGVTTEPLKVALLDLDLRSATVAVRIGIPHPTVWDFVMNEPAGADALDDYLVTHRSGLRVLLGPPKPVTSGRGIEPARIAEIVHQLESDGFHFIFFDISADLGAVTTWVLGAVHDIFVVLTPTASGVQDAYRTTEALRRMGLRHKLSYVINRGRGAIDLREVMADLGGTVMGLIPDDSAVDDAENDHRLASLGETPAARAIAALASHLYPPLQLAVPKRRMQLPWRRRAG